MKIKVGNLVRLSSEAVDNLAPDERDQVRWFGIVIERPTNSDNIVAVYWNKEFPHTIEYICHLEVISEGG